MTGPSLPRVFAALACAVAVALGSSCAVLGQIEKLHDAGPAPEQLVAKFPELAGRTLAYRCSYAIFFGVETSAEKCLLVVRVGDEEYAPLPVEAPLFLPPGLPYEAKEPQTMTQ